MSAPPTLRAAKCVSVACAVALAASCGFPGVRADTRGLGTSPVAQLLDKIWMSSAEAISREVAGILVAGNDGQVTVAHAEAAGFACGASLVGCRYRGEVDYRLLNLPAENAARAARHKSIVIEIVGDNPLVVHTGIVERAGGDPAQDGKQAGKSAAK